MINKGPLLERTSRKNYIMTIITSQDEYKLLYSGLQEMKTTAYTHQQGLRANWVAMAIAVTRYSPERNQL